MVSQTIKKLFVNDFIGRGLVDKMNLVVHGERFQILNSFLGALNNIESLADFFTGASVNLLRYADSNACREI